MKLIYIGAYIGLKMDDIESLVEKKKQLEKLILKGSMDLCGEYNEVNLKIIKLQYPIHFHWTKKN